MESVYHVLVVVTSIVMKSKKMNQSNKFKSRIVFLVSKIEMLEIIYKEYPTNENKIKFFEFEDKLDVALDKYYSDTLMNLKENFNDLFETYLSLPKNQIKKILLVKIKKEIKEKRTEELPEDYYKFDIHKEIKI